MNWKACRCGLALLLLAHPRVLRAGEAAPLGAEVVKTIEQAQVVHTYGWRNHRARLRTCYHTFSLPPDLKRVLAETPASALLASPLSAEGRFTADAALFALSRQAALPPAERLRFALEVSPRLDPCPEDARVRFDFGEVQEDEASPSVGRHPWRPLESLLPHPLTRDLTPTLLPYLDRKAADLRGTWLACQVATEMGDELGPEAQPVLERTGTCHEALVRLQEAARYASGPFDFDKRLGVVTHRGETYLLLPGPEPRTGMTVEVVRLEGSVERVAHARIVERRGGGGLGDHAVLAFADGAELREGEIALGVVTPASVPRMRGASVSVDLDGDGVEERFRLCGTAQGAHLTVWSGRPLQGQRRWHAWAFLDHAMEPRCTPLGVSMP